MNYYHLKKNRNILKKLNKFRKYYLSANLLKMSSRSVTDRNVPAENPLVNMFNKRTPINCDFYFFLQNFSHNLKKADNTQREKMLKKGMKMKDAQNALDFFGFERYVIIKSKLPERMDEIQLMAVKERFDPTMNDAFECVYPKWDSERGEFEAIPETTSETASETASVVSGTTFASVTRINGNDRREFPALPVNNLSPRAQSPSAMTVTTTQTVETATVSEDLSKELISLLDKFKHLSYKDFFLTCTQTALSAKEEHFETFGQLQTAFWNAKSGFFERKPYVPEPPASILPETPSVTETTSVPETQSVTDATNVE